MTPEEAKAVIKKVQENKEHAYHDKNKPGHRRMVEAMETMFQVAYPEPRPGD